MLGERQIGDGDQLFARLGYAPVAFGPVMASARSPAPRNNRVPTSGTSELASMKVSSIRVVLTSNRIMCLGN